MTFKKSALIACATLSAVFVTVSFTAPAMADEAGEIKYRKAVMKSIGGHMGAIAGIFKAETGNSTNLAVHTQGMADLANITASIFPEGSDFGETGTLPAVWDKPDEFAMAVKMFKDAADKLNSAAKSGDMGGAGAAFGGLAKTCKNCHENFREKKNK